MQLHREKWVKHCNSLILSLNRPVYLRRTDYTEPLMNVDEEREARKAEAVRIEKLPYDVFHGYNITDDQAIEHRRLGIRKELLDRSRRWFPGAKEEAIYISNLLGGELYLDKQATEQNFVAESSGKKIIHLAMHTLLNDREPMYSKMVFASSDTDIEDGELNTYEIYNLDMDAKMVVLSSCNTGTGYLQ